MSERETHPESAQQAFFDDHRFLQSVESEAIQRPQYPDDETVELRIKSLLAEATSGEVIEGQKWYFNAHDSLIDWTERYGLPSVQHTAAIVAVMSANTSWEENIRRSHGFIAKGERVGFAYGLDDADRLIRGDDPIEVLAQPGRNNPKVRAFYDNLAFPETSQLVTVDRHVMGMLYDDFTLVRMQLGRYLTPYDHVWASQRVTVHANTLDMLPHQLQATLWMTWRRLNGLAFNGDQLTIEDLS